ncbi:MAG: ribosome recycling factor [Kiritimatiellae bacterium]|nr:ribosome recycling factor [Kiritimatiellia bacterium]
METIDEILLDAEDKMDKAIARLQQDFAGLRTGKASPALVENIGVEYYGATTRLKELAGIATPEPRLIVITPFDPTSRDAICRAILASNIGLTPVDDGRVIRVPIPELSEERRKDLVKVAKRNAEDARIAIRGNRRDANELVKGLKKASKIGEDEEKRGIDEVQKLTDGYIKKIDNLVAAKEKDILEV